MRRAADKDDRHGGGRHLLQARLCGVGAGPIGPHRPVAGCRRVAGGSGRRWSFRRVDRRSMKQYGSRDPVMGCDAGGVDGGRPSGTVTFLFTDIEGSTRRWERDPTSMRDALARHDEALVSAIEVHGGWLFKHTGDGVCAAFGSARAGLELPPAAA